jgi:hypothetical protein
MNGWDARKTPKAVSATELTKLAIVTHIASTTHRIQRYAPQTVVFTPAIFELANNLSSKIFLSDLEFFDLFLV